MNPINWKWNLPALSVGLLSVVLMSGCGGGGGSGGGSGSGGGNTPPPTGGGEETVSYKTLQTGDCASASGDSDFIDQVTLVECSAEHQVEVIGSISLADEDYPGYISLLTNAYDACQPEFENYTGSTVYDSDYDIDVYLPSLTGWQAGDRSVTCLVVDPEGELLTAAAKL